MISVLDLSLGFYCSSVTKGISGGKGERKQAVKAVKLSCGAFLDSERADVLRVERWLQKPKIQSLAAFLII